MKAAIGPIYSITESTSTIISYDCFIEDIKLGIASQSEYLNKTFLSYLLPIFVCLIFVLIFAIFKLIKK